uniref:microtubule organization protein AKNA isoform X2 n=1 Tax=Pristiophorus japonicus TaxID=55135 RepID=UPI00398F75DA
MAVAETQVDADLDPDEDLEEQDEDFFNQMDENGIIGMDQINEYYLQYHPRLEDGLETVEEDGEMTALKELHDYNKLSSLVHLPESVDDESFNISELQDSDPVVLSISAEEDASCSHLIYESEPQEEDGILDDQDSKSHWHPERDQQLDMTEDEKEQGNIVLQSEVGTSKEEDSEEGYSDLPYDEQLEETNPSTLRDSWHRYEAYSKAQNILGRGDDFSVQSVRGHADKLSDQSNGSISHSRTQGKDSSLSTQDCYSDDFEATYTNNVDHYGDVLELSHDNKTISVNEAKKERQDNSSFNFTTLHFNQALLSHLSVEDLANGPDIEAETIPESSGTDSVGESVARFSNKGKCSMKGNQDSGSSSDRQKDKGQKSEVSEAASNKQVKLTNQQKYPHTLDKPHILQDNTGQNSKVNRQINTLNPQRRVINQRALRFNSSKPLSRKVTSETAMYGRGQLNYPLPDFSKVEPRVKFPKDEQAYQRPRSKIAMIKTSRNDPQLLLHSPAEIVRQMLQNSNECSLITSTPSGGKVLEQFKSPQQATEMVYQLQEDYRQLLTKYAEAENTIDRLRIEAKVSLYADPPKPSHSIEMTSLNRGSKVMMFDIPRVQKAEISSPLKSSVQTEYPSVRERREVLEFASTPDGTLSSTQSTFIKEPTAGECLTWALAQQAEVAQKQMDTFERLLQARKVVPGAQQRAFQKFKEGQDALERGYLQAREEHRGLQLKDAGGSSCIIGEFDPDREVEGNIFRLGMHLEDLKERIEQVPESHSSTDHWCDVIPTPNSWVAPIPALQPPVPVPMAQPPIPAFHTPAATVDNPKSESTVPNGALQLGKVDVEVSSISGESEDADAIPETLKHKKMQLEEGFDQLLDQCKNFKDLPLSLDLDRVRENTESPQSPPTAHAQEMETVQPIQEGRTMASKDDLDKYSRKTPEPRQPMKMQANRFKERHQPVLDREFSLAKVAAIRQRTVSPDSKGAYLAEKRDISRRRSVACVDGIASPEHMPHKAPHQTKSVPLEDRIVSPETDSGFVGSESSRLTPAIQTPEHQRPKSRRQSQRETLLKFPTRDDTHANRALRPQESDQRGMTDYEYPTTVRLSNIMRRDSVALADPSRTSSPQQWTGSLMSRTESEPDVQSGPSAYTKQRLCRSSLISSPLAFHPKVHYSSSPLSIHSARDEVIQALEIEVSQLKQHLEETLHKSQGDSEENLSPVISRTQDHLIHQHSPGRKHAEELLEEMKDQVWNKSSASRSYSKLFPQHKSELEISTESDEYSSIPQPLASKLAPGTSVSQTSKRYSSHEGPRSRPVKVKGPYTGTDYSLFVPWTSIQGYATGGQSCPYCRGTQAKMDANGPSKNAPVCTSSPQSNPCPICKGSGACNDQESEMKPEHAARGEPHRKSGRSHKARKQQRVHIADAPPATRYIPPLHYLSYPPQAYCSAPACTYASPIPSRFYYSSGYKVVEPTPNAARKRSKSHHRRPSTTDDIPYINGEALVLSDLSCSLDQAIDAARSMKWTTKKMVRSLRSDLCKAKAIRECHQLSTH